MEWINNYLDIFICTHKNFTPIIKSDVYKIIDSRTIKPNLPLDNKFYSELHHFKHVCDNVKLKKYVGFCHYRRYFDFLDNIPSMNEIFSKYDCITSYPIELGTTVRQQYAQCHNIEDMEIVEDIIKDKYTDYYDMCELFLNGTLLVPYNMFIMKSKDFKEYCEFIFCILDEYLNVVGTDINKRIEDNKDKYLKDYYPNNTVEYQYRIGGYLAERLTNIFLMKKFKKMKIYNVIITEDKYNENNS